MNFRLWIHAYVSRTNYLPRSGYDDRREPGACGPIQEFIIIKYRLLKKIFIPCRESDQLFVHLNFEKNGSSEAKLKARSEASRQNISLFIFYAKLRLALLASLCSAIFCETELDK